MYFSYNQKMYLKLIWLIIDIPEVMRYENLIIWMLRRVLTFLISLIKNTEREFDQKENDPWRGYKTFQNEWKAWIKEIMDPFHWDLLYEKIVVTVIRLFTIGLVTVPIKVFSRNLHLHIFILYALNINLFQCSDFRDRNDF